MGETAHCLQINGAKRCPNYLHTHMHTCTQCIALYLYLTAAATHTCTHTRLETSVRMVYNSINFNMIPTGDRRAASSGAATQASERADKRIFFLYALYKRKLCTINLAERERQRQGQREKRQTAATMPKIQIKKQQQKLQR